MSTSPYPILPDDHIETPVLRKYAQGNRCAVIGAFTGATMRYLLDHGATFVTGVEPQKWAHDRTQDSLVARGPNNWVLYCAALVPWETSKNGVVLLHQFGTDAASLVQPYEATNGSEFVNTLNVADFMEEEDYFDFMVVNIEGSEYQILPWLAWRAGVMLVQFHGPHMPLKMFTDISATGFGFTVLEQIGKGWWLYR